jgi:hypothetical protein
MLWSALGEHHIYDAPPATLAKLDGSGSQGKQSVVPAASHVDARMEVSAALADNDLPGFDGLAAKQFDAQTLCVGIAAVPGRTGAFLMSHLVSLLIAWMSVFG